MNSFSNLLDANPMVIGVVVLAVVVMISVLEKRWRYSSSTPSDRDDPLADGENVIASSDEDTEEQENDYFPQPPSDLMPVPMNSMDPVF